MRGSPLSRGPIGRHLQQWTIRQPHRHSRPNIIAATPSGSGNSPVKLRRPRSRSICAQWRCNMSSSPNVSITARSRPTPDGCRSGGERWAPPTSTTPQTRCTRGPAHKIIRSANRCLPSLSRSRARHPVPQLALHPKLTNRCFGAPAIQIISAVIAGPSSLRAWDRPSG
jgi:hypothetical protein